MIAVLANPNFRLLFLAQVVSLVGTGFTTLALTLLAYDLVGGSAGAVLGTALAIKMVAYVGISPLVGAFAHRLPRKGLLVTLDLVRAGIICFFPLVTQLWQIYLLILLLNTCSAGFTPIFQAIIPDLLPEEKQYARALSLSRLAYDLENLVSPALAALILTHFSYHALFGTNSMAFVISAILVLAATLPRASFSDRPKEIFYNIAFGIRSYLATPRLRGVLMLCAAVAFAGAFVIVNTVVYVRDILGAGERHTAMIFAFSGAGSMLAALLLPRLIDRLSDRSIMLGGGFLLAAALPLGFWEPPMLGLGMIWFLLGLGGSLIQVPVGRILERSCQPSDRSAFFSAQFALSHACWLVAYPLAGHLGRLAGLGPTMLILAAVVLCATLLARRFWPAGDAHEIFHRHEEMVHEHPHVHDDDHHEHPHGEEKATVAAEPHHHAHRHAAHEHSHAYSINLHHRRWPVTDIW